MRFAMSTKKRGLTISEVVEVVGRRNNTSGLGYKHSSLAQVVEVSISSVELGTMFRNNPTS
jgi:hypothetical protein